MAACVCSRLMDSVPTGWSRIYACCWRWASRRCQLFGFWFPLFLVGGCYDSPRPDQGYLSGGGMKILLADDHALFRGGLRYVLQQLSDIVEILEADNFQDGLKL